MTNETRNRIEAYKRALPEMKERVVAAAFLMVMSIMMITSATFAWITLSRAPEVTGMQTTVAANGNLEIALAQGPTTKKVNGKTEKVDAVAPGDSQEGDSSAAEGQSIVEANKTWGNLVNVSDPTYGLKDIALRPALLSDFNRTDYPLNGATYGGDGRVVTTNDRYEFASYAKVEGSDDEYEFWAGDKVNYGVRAITSVKYENVTGNTRINNYSKDTDQLYKNAQEYYGKIVSDGTNEVNTLDSAAGVTCISALEGLVKVFAQDELNEMGMGNGSGTKTSCSKYLWYLYLMMERLETVLEKEGLALVEMANWQAYVESGQENTFTSIEELSLKTPAELKNLGVTITILEDYKKSVKTLQECMEGLYPMAEKCKNPDAPEQEYYWSDIADIVNELVNISSAEIAGYSMSALGKSAAIDLLSNYGKNNRAPVIVKGGLLCDIEKRFVTDDKRVGANVQVTVRAKYSIIDTDITIYGAVYTEAGRTNYEPDYIKDFEYSDELKSGAKGDAIAKDTYGLAMDVWVRTNYPGAVLTLEGSAKYEDQPATITVEGVKYDLYTITVEDIEMDVYQKDEKWYYASTMSEVSEESLGSQTPEEKLVPVIVGYEGENRVWEDWRDLLDAGYIEQDATTQGAGSCFIFYADTPTEQIKIMEMLESFNVAFMDQDGNILGTAKLNLNSAYANQGKVTVPLEVETGTDYTDESGASRKGITKLTQNTPTMITAIIYLNGSKLQNENVLADGELQGQLNIQFGTDSVLIAPDNEELQKQARSITAEVTVNGETIKNGTIGGTEGLEYKEGGYPANVNLTVEGEQPERISGFFVRVINDTQGTRGEEKSFVRNDGGTWSATFNLENPGTYAFNTLIVDGVQYTLHDGTEQSGLNTTYEANRPYVYIRGLRLASASVGVEPGTHMTADSSMKFPVTVKVEAAVKPRQVNAQFFSADERKQYTAILTYDDINDQWVGSANIDSSDTYTLKYISVDGIPMDAPTTGTYTLYLGLTARVSTTLSEKDWRFDYIGPSQITMIARIYDDGGNEIDNLSDVKLIYNNIASPASMTWNEAGYYKGVFDIIQPGELTFKRLELGTVGVIYSASNSPIFLARSLEKPVYKSASADSIQNVIDDSTKAKITVELEDASTASVYAVVEYKLYDTDTPTTYYIESTALGNSRSFELPKLDGKWTLKQLLLQDVYDPDYEDAEGNVVGKWYAKTSSGTTETEKCTTTRPEGEHFIFDTDVVTTEVIATYKITLTYGGTVKTLPFKETFGSADAAFMTSYNSKALTVEVCDYMGRAIYGVDSVTWDIEHNANTMSSYGGYTGTGESKKTITMTPNSSKTVYEAPAQEFHVAGQYTSTITVKSGETLIKELTEVPTFEVRSKAPTVEIEDITMDGSGAYSVDLFETGSIYDDVKSSGGCGGIGATNNYTTHAKHLFASKNTEYISRIENDNRTVWLYFKCSHQDVATYSDSNFVNRKPHEYKYSDGNGVPAVTMSISGMGYATNAKLKFTKSDGGNVVMITNYTADRYGDTYWGDYSSNGTDSFEWTQDGNCKRFVGVMDNGAGENGSDSKTAAGTITADKVILSYGGKDYNFPINTFTIHNPY